MDSKTYISALERQGHHRYKFDEPYRVTVPAGTAGPWTVRRFKTSFDLAYMRYARDGRAPGLGEFTALNHKQRGIVMSDTCAEIEDLRVYLDQLKGHILVSGLGLGMVLQALTKHPRYTTETKSITVLEIDADVIKLTGEHYRKLDNRITIHHASAFTWEPPKGAKYDSAWHDIWDTICEDNVKEFTQLRRRYQRVVAKGQQYCWGQNVIARMRRSAW